MIKILLLAGLSLTTRTYVSSAIIPVTDIVRLSTGDPSLNLTTFFQKDWNDHFQNKLNAINRLLELKHGAIGLLRSVYTTENIRFFRNLVDAGIRIGNFSLENLPDEALSTSELISKGINKLFNLHPTSNQETLENYGFEESSGETLETDDSKISEVVANQSPPIVFQSTIEEINTIPNGKNEDRVARSVETNENVAEVLNNYRENEAVLKEYEDRFIALDRLIRNV